MPRHHPLLLHCLNTTAEFWPTGRVLAAKSSRSCGQRWCPLGEQGSERWESKQGSVWHRFPCSSSTSRVWPGIWVKTASLGGVAQVSVPKTGGSKCWAGWTPHRATSSAPALLSLGLPGGLSRTCCGSGWESHCHPVSSPSPVPSWVC